MLGIVGVLTLLAVLPDLFRKTRYSLDVKDAQVSLGNFPLDKEFKVIMGGPTGKSVSLKSLISDPQTRLIVNFWATWCPPCLEEMPSLEYLSRKLGNGPTKLVTFSVDTKAEVVPAMFPTLDLKPTFLVLHDPDGKFSTGLGTTKFPETYLVDAQGKILYKWLGPQDWTSSDVIERVRLRN